MIGSHVPNETAAALYDRFRSYMHVDEGLCAFFLRSFLRQRSWQAVVVSEELSVDEGRRLSSICDRHGLTEAWALDIDHFDPGFFFDVQLNDRQLISLEETFLTPSYLVVEKEERFMLVSDSDYYWSIAGDSHFLAELFGKSVSKANAEFLDATRAYRRTPGLIGETLGRIAAEAAVG